MINLHKYHFRKHLLSAKRSKKHFFIMSTSQEEIKFKFPCPRCGFEINQISCVPWPNFAAEKMKDSASYSEDYTVCENCQEDIKITIWNDFYSHENPDISIDGVDDKDINIVEFIDPEWEELKWVKQETKFLQILKNQLRQVRTLIEKNTDDIKHDDGLNNATCVMNHVYIFAALEGFLESTYKHYALSYEVALQKHCIEKIFSLMIKILVCQSTA